MQSPARVFYLSSLASPHVLSLLPFPHTASPFLGVYAVRPRSCARPFLPQVMSLPFPVPPGISGGDASNAGEISPAILMYIAQEAVISTTLYVCIRRFHSGSVAHIYSKRHSSRYFVIGELRAILSGDAVVNTHRPAPCASASGGLELRQSGDQNIVLTSHEPSRCGCVRLAP
jgi:hypothetical protein